MRATELASCGIKRTPSRPRALRARNAGPKIAGVALGVDDCEISAGSNAVLQALTALDNRLKQKPAATIGPDTLRQLEQRDAAYQAVLKTVAFDHKLVGPDTLRRCAHWECARLRPGTLLGTLGPISLAPTRILERKRDKATVF